MLLLNGDCIEEMQKMIDEGVQVDSVVTDPPYELGFMGKSWDSTGIAFQKETWELAYQLLKPGGHLLAFSSSRTYHRMAVAIEDSGFDIRDQMMWLYGSGFPKSHNIGKAVDAKLGNEREVVGTKSCGYQVSISKTRKEQGYRPNETNATTEVVVDRGNTEHEGWGTALKPAHEPIVMARKPLSEKSIADNILKHGTGGINIDGSRVEGGRFPANVMHDGSEEVVSGFPHTKSGTLSPDMNIKESTGWSGGSKADRVKNTFIGNEGSAARFFYCPKVSKSERGEDNTHPTVKPQELMKYLCRLVTPKGGTLLDPFMGSGSTGMAAKDEGFKFIGIEREKEYFEIAEKRINAASPLMEFMLL